MDEKDFKIDNCLVEKYLMDFSCLPFDAYYFKPSRNLKQKMKYFLKKQD